jgi:two-component system phosphate regulon response regulator OmpR
MSLVEDHAARGPMAAAGRPRVVAVDDDQTTRIFVRSALAPLELDLKLVADAKAFRAARSENRADLSIIDVDLPDCAGHQLAEEVGAAGEPMIFFSIHDDTRSRLKALEAGALEYLVKPVCPHEFMLRVANVLGQTGRTAVRRASVAHVFAGVRFVPSHRTLDNGTEVVRLTASESAVLEMFTKSPHRTIGRDAVAARISPRGAARDPRIVDVLVYRIRRKLRDVGADPRTIVTIPFEGYALAEAVKTE